MGDGKNNLSRKVFKIFQSFDMRSLFHQPFSTTETVDDPFVDYSVFRHCSVLLFTDFDNYKLQKTSFPRATCLPWQKITGLILNVNSSNPDFYASGFFIFF
jgi:hypothetical protein